MIYNCEANNFFWKNFSFSFSGDCQQKDVEQSTQLMY